MNQEKTLQETRDVNNGNSPPSNFHASHPLSSPPSSPPVITRRHVSFQGDDGTKEAKINDENEEEDPMEGFESMERAILNSSSSSFSTMPSAHQIPMSSSSTTMQRASITNSSNASDTTPSVVGSEHLASEKIPKNSFLRDYILPATTITQKRKLIHILYLIICAMVLFMFSFLVESRKITTFAPSPPYHHHDTSVRPAAVSNDIDESTTATTTTMGTTTEINSEIAANESKLTKEQQERINTLRSILSSSISTIESLSLTTTPQYRALHWLAIQDERNVAIPLQHDSFQLAKLKQRYILALFYFNTGGQKWKQTFDFLSPEDECEWNGRVDDDSEYTGGVGGCDNNLLIQTIALWNNNLEGQLPMELGELSTVKVMSLYSNKLWGTVPANFAKMTSLKTLYLHDNELSGDLGFMCTTSTTSWISNFRSDCFGTNPMVHCPCCNVCCARDENGQDQCYTQ